MISHIEEKVHHMPFKQTINKNGNKFFRKKIFQLSLIILLIISIKYVHQVYLLKQC